jgi:hypothetical protein
VNFAPQVKAGFDNLRQLSRFVQKRVAAETDVAASILGMCVSGRGAGMLGRANDLLDTLTESGKVRKMPSWPRSWANCSLF